MFRSRVRPHFSPENFKDVAEKGLITITVISYKNDGDEDDGH